ncbi:MAG: hypothetical protein ACFFEF_01760 [Candidatus Thorarchaeota archaeon]
MAEEFLNRLNKLEKKVDGLGETLMRMITILGNVTELKSDIRIVKEELLDSIKSIPQPSAAGIGVTKQDLVDIMSNLPSGGGGLSTDDVSHIMKAELGSILEQLLGAIYELKDEFDAQLQGISMVAPEMPVRGAATQVADSAPAVSASSTLSPDRSMKVADQLDIILDSLKMGCKAGDVLDVMAGSKDEIMKIVPSDQIMVKIDKWAGIVSTYSKRHELQAKDILKLKKELKEEIQKYRPA